METGIVYGRIPVLEYLKSGLPKEKSRISLLSSGHGQVIEEIVALAKKQKVRIEHVDKKYFKDQRLDEENSQGIMLHNTPLYRGISDEKLQELAEEKRVILILDQITDPHNGGAIIRSAEAFGVGAIILPQNNSIKINPTVIKTAAGATAHVPIRFETNLARTMDQLKELGYWIIGTSDRGQTIGPDALNLSPAALVIGSEGKGMRPLTMKKCDSVVRIDLKGKSSSLNASVAAGIMLYEFTKISG